MSDEVLHWQETIARLWNCDVALYPLYGEYDFNFKAIDRATGEQSVVKIMRAGCEIASVHVQVQMLTHLAKTTDIPVPAVIPAFDGEYICQAVDKAGVNRLIWRLNFCPGKLFAESTPTDVVLHSIGQMIGKMHLALANFTHPALDVSHKWDLSAGDWIEKHLDAIDSEKHRAQIQILLNCFKTTAKSALNTLPQQALHNDINDHNLLVSNSYPNRAKVSGLIDFGDALYGPCIVDLAIACAYLAMGQQRPLEPMARIVEGYVSERALTEVEVDLLWPLMQMRLAVSVTNSGLEKAARPDDPYVVVSEKPALDLLGKARNIDTSFAKRTLRQAAGLAIPDPIKLPTPEARMFSQSLAQAPVLDLSPWNTALECDAFHPDAATLSKVVVKGLSDNLAALGRYSEPRLIYGGSAFGPTNHPAQRRRTIHIGIDVFLPAGTPVHSVTKAQVVFAGYLPDLHDYGGVVILEHHDQDGPACRALYGHLSRASAETLSPGDWLEAGQGFATLGNSHENGGWPPHLHLQAGGLDAPDTPIWNGVVDADELDHWRAIYPDPTGLLGEDVPQLDAKSTKHPAPKQRRKAVSAPNLKLSYNEPIHMVRGSRCVMVDALGRRYLDAYNNVPHVGHAHPHVVQAIADQALRLNTNTRYLSETYLEYSERLLALAPDHLDTVMFVNSGSEANELAIRLARKFTGHQDILVSEHGYHGITQTNIDLSHYKFAGKGGDGQRDWVHVLPVPNSFSGHFTRPDAGLQYAKEAQRIVSDIRTNGTKLAACLIETYPSVGGQVIPPAGYLSDLANAVQTAGALMIMDEVQTGLGRLGQSMWGFDTHGVKPDIVVLGKPIGNGHPMGAVLTTKAIAQAFDTGMEFFSTFGGSNVSCAAGLAVLDVMEQEDLMANAQRAGDIMLNGLNEIFNDIDMPTDVRGQGLFLGVEVLEQDGTPATALVGDIVNAMQERRVLIGSDGPHDNVLKIRPPICFTQTDCKFLLDALKLSVQELGL